MKFDHSSFILGFYVGLVALALSRFIVSSVAKRRKELLELGEKVKKMSAEKPRPILESAIKDIFQEMDSVVNSDEPKRIATLTKAMIDQGPVRDIPKVKWSDAAVLYWLKDQGFELEKPILTRRHIPSGDVVFIQEIKDKKGGEPCH